MVEICVGPSELHLKKELTALRKARFLRDPETCSSWRSPLSSRSLAATCSNYGNGTRGIAAGGSNSGGLLEIPSKSENRRKKVYLYNWGHNSSKSSDSGTKANEENRQESVQGSPEDSLSNPQKVDYKGDAYVEDPMSICTVRGPNPETPVRRTVRKFRRSAISKKRVIKNSSITKLLDVPSSNLGAFNSVEQSDDMDYCNSEDLQQSTHEVTRKTGYHSRSASPLFSGSGRGNWSHSSKILRNTRREESSYSYTPGSTSSYNRFGGRDLSIVGSWDGTTASFDGDETDHLDLPRRQGCGIPCYWSKKMKDRGCGGFYSPSLSDTLRRKGSSILCGSQTLYNKRRSSGSRKQKYMSKSSQGLPLLSNSCKGADSSVDTASDELSTNFGELDLEALSRLDGKRWSSCRSQEGLELALPGRADTEMQDHRSLSQKYRPKSFDEIIGQNIVVQSLRNTILRGRIAPAYLFQGPRGTGKTSTARVFAAALNCLSAEENKPCGFCRECTDFATGSGSNVREVDATNKKGMDRIRYVLKNMSMATTFSRYKVFIIDECHMLSSKIWSAFMKFLEEPPSRVVFVFITIDPDNLPRAIVSRCQKYLFPKIKDADIIRRLRKLSAEENLDVELDALDLIALNSEGSLRDAETMLDQLSLLGKRITSSLVNDLVGVVSDEKLLDLLEIAMSSDSAETVKRSRELMDSGVDPMALMSQLAGLIMDIIAGTYRLAKSQCTDSVFGAQSLTESELERLQQALKIISDAEKQLRLSSERSTWFTAALLQLGSGHNPEPTHSSSSSSKQSTKKVNEGEFNMANEASRKNNNILLTHLQSCTASIPRVTSGHSSPHGNPSYSMQMIENPTFDVLPTGSGSILAAAHRDEAIGKKVFKCVSPDKLNEIWRRCIERCHSKTLRELLCAHGKLVSITEIEGVLIAFIAFGDGNIKSRVERFLSSITNSIEIVLRHNVEVRIGLLPANYMKGLKSVPDSPASKHAEIVQFMDKERKVDSENLNDSSNKDQHKGILNVSRLQRSLGKCDSSTVEGEVFQVASFPIFSSEGNIGARGIEGKGQEIIVQRTHTVASDEQRLESAWLQAAEKGTPGLVSHSKPEKNQVLPQNGVSCQNQNGSSMAPAMSSKHWEDELNHEIKALKNNDTQGHQTEQIGVMINHYAISPSLLHSNNFATNFDKEIRGYESGPGCNGLLCWKTSKPYRGKVKQGARVRSQKNGHLSWFGQCGKSKATESRFRR